MLLTGDPEVPGSVPVWVPTMLLSFWPGSTGAKTGAVTVLLGAACTWWEANCIPMSVAATPTASAATIEIRGRSHLGMIMVSQSGNWDR